MTRAAIERDWSDRTETEGEWHDGSFQNWSRDRDPDHPFHRNDGVLIYADEKDDGSWDALLGRGGRHETTGDGG
tara:strand:+ start:709 stop:930 length:222 start_codon:yes stop_codon:yes gene_type:complete